MSPSAKPLSAIQTLPLESVTGAKPPALMRMAFCSTAGAAAAAEEVAAGVAVVASCFADWHPTVRAAAADVNNRIGSVLFILSVVGDGMVK